MFDKIKKIKGIITLTALSVVLMLSITGCSGKNDQEDTSSQNMKEGESLVIPTNEISETAKFYPVSIDDIKMEVVAVKAPDGTIRTSFNTCQVCNGSPLAYFEQKGTTLECQNCGNRFPMDRVEVEAGGCNPIPIFAEDKTVTEESITISYDTLKASKDLFNNWNK